MLRLAIASWVAAVASSSSLADLEARMNSQESQMKGMQEEIKALRNQNAKLQQEIFGSVPESARGNGFTKDRLQDAKEDSLQDAAQEVSTDVDSDSQRRLSSTDAFAEITYDGDKLRINQAVHISGDIISNGTIASRQTTAFLAYATSTMTGFDGSCSDSGSDLMLDTVKLNKGGNYDSSSYMFTAPISGLYHFYASGLTADSTNGVKLFFFVNTVKQQPGGATWGSSALQASVQGDLLLNADDTVTVRNCDSGDITSESYGSYFGYFGGHLVTAL